MSIESIEIGRRVRRLRKAQGLSQEAVARQTNIGLKAYGDLERGRTADPHYSTLTNIAHALGVTVAELVGEEAPVPLAEAPPDTGSLPEWATTSDMNTFSERVSRLPLDELKRLTVDLIRGETVLTREDLPLSREERDTRAANVARAMVLDAEFRRERGVAPPREFEVAYRRHLAALESPTTPDVEAQRPAPGI